MVGASDSHTAGNCSLSISTGVVRTPPASRHSLGGGLEADGVHWFLLRFVFGS